MPKSQPSRPRVLVYHPNFRAHGGGEMVAAWFLEALSENFAPTVVCHASPD